MRAARDAAVTSAHDDRPLRERLQSLIDELPPGSVAVGPLVDQLGRQGLLLLTMLLTLVFLIPVSIPGVSTVFGAVIAMIGASRLIGRPLWLPQRVRRREVASGRLRAALEAGVAWVGRLERISRPGRMTSLVEGRAAAPVNDLALVLGALLLMAPFGFIPFSNTVPGIALMCLAIGLMQRDGALILLGHLGNLLSIAYFAALIGGGGLALHSLVSKYWPF
ncbi:MAG TPA: exopolysaccharide biosynthesis protein [Pseudoxanthomonas sp.]|nr:exopolysaccharide biosynthesis protein [Pseudoxanthomonas sp.]